VDCHFFISSTCDKGSECEFRHSEAAKSNDTNCKHWLEKINGCTNVGCRFRHPTLPLKPDGSRRQCIFEINEGVCGKPGVCLFEHKSTAQPPKKTFHKNDFAPKHAAPPSRTPQKLAPSAAPDQFAASRKRARDMSAMTMPVRASLQKANGTEGKKTKISIGDFGEKVLYPEEVIKPSAPVSTVENNSSKRKEKEKEKMAEVPSKKKENEKKVVSEKKSKVVMNAPEEDIDDDDLEVDDDLLKNLLDI